MISLWFQKGVWRNSVSTYDGCLCLQLIWKPWAVGVRNVPNGPRNLSSHFTTAGRRKKVTMNSCIGVNVNPPRREEGRNVCMKFNYLNSLAAEYSSNFLIKCHDSQWCASLFSPFFFCWLNTGDQAGNGSLSLLAQVSTLAEAAASRSPAGNPSSLGCTGTV